MNERLLKVLACPNCMVSVNLEGRWILCPVCFRRYELMGEVPIMLDEEGRREVAPFLESPGGKAMISEYSKKGILNILRSIALKITKGGGTLYLPAKRLKELINGGDQEKMILEIGSGQRRLTQRIINLDVAPFKNVDVVGEGSSLPFLAESFDVVIIIAVLEHTRRAKMVIEEAFRVLKPQGIIYAEVPFLFRYHSYPTDFWRYTQQGVIELFSQFKEEEIGICVGPSSGLLTFLTHYATLFSFSKNEIINNILKAVAFGFFFPLKYLDLLLVKNNRAYELAAGFYFIGQKR